MPGSQGLQPLRSTQCHRPSHDSEPRPPFPPRAGHPIVRDLHWRWRCDHRCGGPRPKPHDSPGDHPVFSGSCGHGRPGALKAKDRGRLKPKSLHRSEDRSDARKRQGKADKKETKIKQNKSRINNTDAANSGEKKHDSMTSPSKYCLGVARVKTKRPCTIR